MNRCTEAEILNILSLDGGGSKGVYTLGVLQEVEARLGGVLADHFGLIYGTSTGAIIAALLSKGKSVAQVKRLYFLLIPKVMKHSRKSTRSKVLLRLAEKIFKKDKFDVFQTYIGIVATNYEFERPLIFKNSAKQAFSMPATFKPGFGCTVVEALMASTAAFPYFERVVVKTDNQGSPELMDGGFAANNPTLFAIADGVQTLKYSRQNIRVLSVGVGHYNEPQKIRISNIFQRLWPFKMIRKQLAINSNTVEIMRKLFFNDIACVRIDSTYADPRYATDLLEADKEKLNQLFVLGRESYSQYEPDIDKYFKS